ncbi:MAG: hypothetical protein R3B51_04040 [Thermodesulfobacteriota bacterium]
MTAALAYLTRPGEGGVRHEREGPGSSRVPSHTTAGTTEAVSFLNLVSAVTGKEYAFDEDKAFLTIDRGKYGKAAAVLDEFRAGKRAVAGILQGPP